jgi:hypothetical protein
MTKPYPTVLWGGLLAGALDITYACVNSGLRGRGGPERVLQSVASGLLGKGAFEGGAGAAALGLFCHFLIAVTAAFVYYAASRQLDILVRQPVVCGLLYGVVVYVVMSFVVVPLSAAPFRFPLRPGVIIPGLLVHMFLIGLPIALFVRRANQARS